MTTTTSTTTATFSKVSVREEDAIRLILEFLSRRELCISQLSLERESGIYNCNVGDDLIFLRQLILDGQWEDALQFVTPLESLEHFASRQFHFLIYKHKYVELLCIRAEASCAPSSATTSSSLASVEVAVQDIIDCLNQLEAYAPSREDYHRLSSLLTIPSLSDDEELRNWNPNSWRLKCFHDVMPLVERFMTQQPTTASDTASNSSSTNKSGNNNNCIARNDRLMNLIFKGLMYEVCLETVAAKMVAADGGSNQCTTTTIIDPDVMNGVESTFNLHSFLQSVPAALLAAYQADRSVRKNIGGGEGANRGNEPPPMINLAIEKHDKPLLVASWSEMILAAPIKPNVFPHTQVPFTRIKAADLMSKSLSASLMKSASTRDMMAMSVCDIAQFSRSTLASTGFHLNRKDDDDEEGDEEGEDKENTTNNSLQLELTTAIANCDNVMSTSVDRLFRSADAFTSSKGLQLTSKEAAAIGGVCSDRMPTITELATPTTPSTEAAAEFAPEFTSSPADQRRRADDDVDEMNESYLDIWMRSQHRRLKKNKLNRTLSNRLNSGSGAHRRPPSLAAASTATTTAAASVKRTAASTFSSGGGGGLPSSARKHSSTASWSSSSAGKSSSITQQQQQQQQPMPSASGPASSTSSFSGSSAASTGRVAADQQQQQQQQLGHMPHNSSRFVATPANNTATSSTARPLTSTPLKWLPAGGGGGAHTATANSIRSELFDDRSVLRNSPITTEERNYGGGISGYRHSAVAASNDGGNYYGYNSSSSSNSNKHGLRSSLSSPSPHPNHPNHLHHQHSQHSQHTSHQHSVDLSNDNDTNNTTNEAIRFVSVANFEDQQAIRTAEFHPSGRYFAIGSNSKQLRVFQYSSQDSNNNTADSLSDISPPELIFKRPKYHKGSIYCLAWNKIGNLLATGSNDKTIKLATFNPESPSFLSNEAELPVHDGTVRDLCFMDDLTNGSSLLLSGGAGDCKINITDCETATTFLSLSGHSGPVLSLYTWGGAMFVSGSQDRTIRFWDLRSNSCINFVTCPTISRTKPGGAVAAVSVDPTGKLLVSGHEDSTCMLYDVRGGRVIQTFHPHSADIRTLRFSSKAYYLLSGGYDNKIVLTDMQGDLTQPLKSVVVAEHEDKVIQCRWHPTEFVFLSTSADKTAKLWALPD